jgi:hypothetical protein
MNERHWSGNGFSNHWWSFLLLFSTQEASRHL